MLVIRLKRTGKTNSPAFRIVVAEKKRSAKGKVIEVLGHYLPTRDPVEFECNLDRVTHWIGMGAQPSNTMARLLAKQSVKDMEKYIKTYTKKSKRNASEEEEAAATPATDTDTPQPEKASSDEEPAEKQKPSDEPSEAQSEESKTNEADDKPEESDTEKPEQADSAGKADKVSTEDEPKKD